MDIDLLAKIISEDIKSNNGLIIEGEDKDIPIVVTIAVFRKHNDNLEVLLERRGKNPEKYEWALPGGHLEDNESYREGATRELREETTLKIPQEDLIYVTEHTRNTKRAKNDVLFMVLIPYANSAAEAGSDADYIEWTKISDVPELVFEHNEFIEHALKKLGRDTSEINIKHSEYTSKRGKLIVFEGLDGAGKTKQTELLEKYLDKEGHSVRTTKWSSSDLLHGAIKQAKKDRSLDPMVYSTIHALDLLQRYNEKIIPWLSEDKIVICDRYIYTSYARDSVRGVNTAALDAIYQGFRKPDLLFYCKVSPEVTLKRLKKDDGLTFFGTGMDLHLSPDFSENFVEYQKHMIEAYSKVLKLSGKHHTIDTSKDIKSVHNSIVKIVESEFS
jgi:dTMP kinase